MVAQLVVSSAGFQLEGVLLLDSSATQMKVGSSVSGEASSSTSLKQAKLMKVKREKGVRLGRLPF